MEIKKTKTFEIAIASRESCKVADNVWSNTALCILIRPDLSHGSIFTPRIVLSNRRLDFWPFRQKGLSRGYDGVSMQPVSTPRGNASRVSGDAPLRDKVICASPIYTPHILPLNTNATNLLAASKWWSQIVLWIKCLVTRFSWMLMNSWSRQKEESPASNLQSRRLCFGVWNGVQSLNYVVKRGWGRITGQGRACTTVVTKCTEPSFSLHLIVKIHNHCCPSTNDHAALIPSDLCLLSINSLQGDFELGPTLGD